MRTELSNQLYSFIDGDWQYSHWPEFHPLDEYEQVQQMYLSQCKTIEAVHSIWRVGEIGVPGISDLDFVLGLSDSMPPETTSKLSIKNLDENGSYISFHQPLILNEALLKNLFIWGSVSPPIHLYGSSDNIQELTEKEATLMAIISLSDIFVQAQPRMLLRTLLNRKMHVRGTLCQINALKHTLRLYRDATKQSTAQWDHFVNEFTDYRQRWFDLGDDRVERLRNYTVQAIIMLFEVMDAYQQALCEQGWFDNEKISRKSTYFISPNFQTYFTPQWDNLSALTHTISTWRHSNIVSLQLPFPFLQPLHSYMHQKGSLSKHVRRYLWTSRLSSTDIWHKDLLTMASRHVQVRNAHVNFLYRNGLLWDDANFSSLGLWPPLITDRSMRNQLRKVYYQVRKWKRITNIRLAKI